MPTMDNLTENSLTRRHFIASLAASGAAISLPESGQAEPALSAHNEANGLAATSRAPHAPIQIVCTERLSAAEAEQIRAAGKNIQLHLLGEASDPAKLLAEAEVILGSVDARTVLAAPKLKWVQTWAAGVERAPAELMAHPSQLTNMQRVFAPVIAESAIALLLSLTRGLAQTSIPAFGDRKWVHPPGSVVLDDLYGKTIGIVGMGGIGSETARRLHYGFNMKVLATDAKPLPRPEFVAELHDPTWLMEMVPQVDVLMSAAPLTKETRLLFNEAVFSRMKPSAYFINVSRGGLVDQNALVKVLKEGRIRGAGLDVTTPEPLPADHPLWTCSNLVITPHNSGNAPIRQKRLIALVAENVRRYSSGLPLLNVVDKAKGY
ncbi:D-2-hydroxyacid dehydrogenase [Nibrella saemangeumensis]|uniref:D-2-hydroxyacid dehydrogenase n=1 Tax=Nibrella saemangeumensis TaxID=1084526 RepID=A0ABP8NQA2_9BACT